jgi:hypothetical protein
MVDFGVDTSPHPEGATMSILIASLTAPLAAAILAGLFVAAMSGGFRIRTIEGRD